MLGATMMKSLVVTLSDACLKSEASGAPGSAVESTYGKYPLRHWGSLLDPLLEESVCPSS